MQPDRKLQLVKDPSLHKLPPQNIEAEESLLSALLINPEDIERVVDILAPQDFYRTAHQKIYSAIVFLYKAKSPIDIVTVKERLHKQNTLEEIGGVTYLVKLTETIPLAINPPYTAEIIKSKSILRELIQVSNNITQKCFDDSESTPDILDEAQKQIIAIEAIGAKESGSAMMCDVVHDAIDFLEKKSKSDSEITGLSTGWKEIDRMTSGLQAPDFIIIAARPGMGKTSFACNLVDHVTMGGDAAVIFSLEMSKVQIVNRILPKHSHLNGAQFRTGNFSKEGWNRLMSAANKVSDSPLIINDDSDLSYSDIRRLARKYKKEKNIKLVVVDYLQLVSGDRDKSGNRVNEVSSITRNFKNMAKELDIPVIALSQLNRSLEQRNNKRPVLSDLRESGSLEQDSDIVIFIYRDEVYNENSESKGIAEIIFRKFRNGEPGTVSLAWNDKITAFFDLAHNRS